MTLTATDPARLGFDPVRLARIDRWMERYVEERKFPGCSVVIARHGEVAHVNAAGLRSVEDGTPWDLDTVVRIYSMTKPIVSTAFMMLVEAGLVPLAAPLSRFVPEFGEARALIPGATSVDQTEPAPSPTLHQLLTHTSGLTYHFNPGLAAKYYDENKLSFDPRNETLADCVRRLTDAPLSFQPGARWEYSVGIDVIGRVIEILSGQSLDAFLKERIFEPLGMTETAFTVPDSRIDRFASLYTPLAGDPTQLNEAPGGGETLRLADNAVDSPFRYTAMHSGGGGLLGTLGDYLKFGEMIRRGVELDGTRLLSPRTIAYMRRNHLPGDIASMGPKSFAEMPMEGMGFGLGGSVVIDPARVRVIGSVGDWGWGGMASTYFWTDPEFDLTVVFFTQLAPSSAYTNRAELKALVHGALTE
jgi:CubicO group peptidase (beta-lactamase class C family)